MTGSRGRSKLVECYHSRDLPDGELPLRFWHLLMLQVLHTLLLTTNLLLRLLNRPFPGPERSPPADLCSAGPKAMSLQPLAWSERDDPMGSGGPS